MNLPGINTVWNQLNPFKMYRLILSIIITLPFMSVFSQSTKPYNDRLLVVGGGGARGAWGAGYAQYLTRKNGPYKVAFGTSTGSLMIPMIILNDLTTLKTAYTSVTQKSIFNINP
jgi:hypothetical protein